jgi:mRNA interferase RelE/StbE
MAANALKRYYRSTGPGNCAILSLVKTIILTLSAAKDLDTLARDARAQVEAGLHRYAMTGRGDVKALQGRDGYRLRIGGYRVIFDEDATTILAIYIGRRATTAYKRN